MAANKPGWMAACLAPLAAPVAYTLFALLFVPDTTREHERDWQSVLMALAIGLVPASYIASSIFGAPLVWLLRRMNKLSFWKLVAFSAPAGALASASLLGALLHFGAGHVRLDGPSWADAASFLAASAILGMINGAAFGWLAGLRKPAAGSDGKAQQPVRVAQEAENTRDEA